MRSSPCCAGHEGGAAGDRAWAAPDAGGRRAMSGRVDVLIAGGGMVGASLAAALAPSGLGVMVVEAIAPSAAQPSFDDRATALSATSIT